MRKKGAWRERGATLVVGLILLSLVTLLGLAGASTAHVEQQLAQNEQFRENASSAASAGIELALSRLMTSSSPVFAPTILDEPLAGTADRVEVRLRFAGWENALPQAAGTGVAGAHFDIESTGFSTRRAVDRQKVGVMLVLRSADAITLPCAPEVPGRRCYAAGELVRLSWQRVPVD